MAGFLPPVVAELRANITDFQAKMSAARGEVATLEAQGSAGMTKFAAVGKGALLGLGAAFVAVGALGVKFALDAEANQARLSQAIKNTGHDYDEYAGRIDAATASGRALGFSGGEVKAAITDLTNVTHNAGTAVGLMSLAEDIARGRRISLAQATDILVKVESGRVGMLGRLGIAVRDANGQVISQEEALRKLSDMYGGQASAYAETFRGKLEILEAQAKYLVTTLGQALLPVITAVVTAFADGINWLDQHREAAYALAIVVGGPLVAAMLTYVATQAMAIGSSIIGFFTGLAGAATTLAGELMGTAAAWEAEIAAQEMANGVFLEGAGAAAAADASFLGLSGTLAIAAGSATLFGAMFLGVAAASYVIVDALGLGEEKMDHFQVAGHRLAQSAIKDARESGNAYLSLKDTYRVLGDQLDIYTDIVRKSGQDANARKDDVSALTAQIAANSQEVGINAGQFRKVREAYDEIGAILPKLKEKYEEERKQQELNAAKAKATAAVYGYDLPSAHAMSTEAQKQLNEAVAGSAGVFDHARVQAALYADSTGSVLLGAEKVAADFAKTVADSFTKATDPFAHFGDQATVTEAQMEQFFVGSNLAAQNWSGTLQGVIGRIQTELPEGARAGVMGLVMEMAKAGPSSQPALDAFVAMINEHGLQWVADMQKSSQDSQTAVTQAFNQMAIDAAIKTAETSAVAKAAFADLQEGGTSHLQALMRSHDTAMAGMAYGTALKVGEMQGSVDSLHGKDVKLGAFPDIPAVQGAQRNFDDVHGHDVVFGASVSHGSAGVFAQMAGNAAQSVGNIFWKRGGTAGLAAAAAGMNLRGPRVIVAGEAGPESVLPLTRYGDMVTTIRNSGYASAIARAAWDAIGGGGSTRSGMPTPSVTHKDRDGTVVQVHHHHGNIIIEGARDPEKVAKAVGTFLETGRVA